MMKKMSKNKENKPDFYKRIFIVNKYGVIDYELEDDAKVIFLDIDGVLNSSVYADEYAKKHEGDPKYHIWCDPDAVQKLAKFCIDNSTWLIISSSWRYTNDIQSTVDRLEEIPGFSPIIPYIVGQTSRKGKTRGEQIKDFTDTFGIMHYCIVDDDTDMRDDQQAYFVHVDSYYGLTLDEYYEQMKEMLKL